MFIAWYGHQGETNPFASARLIRVSGGEGGYSVACLATPFRREAATVAEVAVTNGLLGETPPLDSTGTAVWKEVFPFADGARALLLTYEKSTTLICGSSIYDAISGQGADSVGSTSPFYEKIDLLVVPPATEKDILEARVRLRPRLIAVAAPCAMASTQNIVCGPVDGDGGFRYNFRVKNRKLRFDDGR